MSETKSETNTSSATATLSSERGGIMGVKAGMTQFFNDDGAAMAVTVVDLAPNTVTQVKTKAKEGYSAVQVGVLSKEEHRSNKAELGHAKKSGTTPHYFVQEFRFSDDKAVSELAAGTVLTAEFIKEGDLVDIVAISKGKGFQGGMKRYHMGGGAASHGASISHRSLGSIGNRADPGKCFKNKKMPGQMGNVRTTVQNVRVVKIDLEKGLLLLNGSVPGPKSGIVTIRKAIKSAAQKAAK